MTIKWNLLFYLLFGLLLHSCKQAEKKSTMQAKNDSVNRPMINEIVNKIAGYSTVDAAGVGIAGAKTEQYERFEKLIKYATVNELITLTDHNSPAVKAYSFWALAKKKFSGLSLILKKHVHDSASFRFFEGCISMPERINDFYVSVNKDSR